MAVLYRHIRLDTNEPFYVGIGKTTKRAYSKHGRSKHWNNIYEKAEYEVNILFEDISWEEACKKEAEFISLYGRRDLGLGSLVNMTDGGDGVENLSKEAKEKIGAATKGNQRNKWTLESRAKLSKTNTGRIDSLETRKKKSEGKLGDKNPMKNPESVLKMRNSKKGKPAKNKGVPGKPWSEERRLKYNLRYNKI
jgi:hypothetical protein